MTLSEAVMQVGHVRQDFVALAPRCLTDVLVQLGRLYREFPELYLLEPIETFVEPILPLLQQLTLAELLALFEVAAGMTEFRALDRPETDVFRQLLRSGRVQEQLARITERLPTEQKLPAFAAMSRVPDFLDAPVLQRLAASLPSLLGPAGEADHRLAALGSVRGRLQGDAATRPSNRVSEQLLAFAERFKASTPPHRRKAHRDLTWPSGPMGFDEFLLQWPCEIELPVGGSDADFVEAAYRDLLLRPPAPAELQQYVRLLEAGEISRKSVVQDLVWGEEILALQRHVRVVLGSETVSSRDEADDDEIAAVAWPSIPDRNGMAPA